MERMQEEQVEVKAKEMPKDLLTGNEQAPKPTVKSHHEDEEEVEESSE